MGSILTPTARERLEAARFSTGRPDAANPWLVAVVGPTATGKSALGLSLAERLGGEIVSCDSTAVYRGFDIGTDKVPIAERRGICHHVIDIVDPTDTYSAARFAADAASAIRDITRRGRIPILVGGTGLYYRALTRGIFPGPGRDAPFRARLARVAARRGVETLHRLLGRIDEASAARIQPRDERRLVRALEVYHATGRNLTEHFDDTRSPIAEYDIVTIGLELPMACITERVRRRVERQFTLGLLDEIRGLLRAGVPSSAAPFTGLVYRQALELLGGVRDEIATRELIARENRRYARRQLIWFRKEPTLRWFSLAGEAPGAADAVWPLLAQSPDRRLVMDTTTQSAARAARSSSGG